MTRKHPWLALLGWFPLFYVVGLVRFWGRPWCMWDGGFVPISSPLPALWWPTKLYQHRRLNQRRYLNQRRCI